MWRPGIPESVFAERSVRWRDRWEEAFFRFPVSDWSAKAPLVAIPAGAKQYALRAFHYHISALSTATVLDQRVNGVICRCASVFATRQCWHWASRECLA